MRRIALVTLVLTLALPAAAQQGKADDKAPPPPPRRMTRAPAPADAAGQCKAACSRAYYFCIAGADQTDCSPKWSQCRSRCNR